MTLLVMRRALRDYARRPLNLALLVAVPAVLVIALAGEFARFSKLLATGPKPAHLEVATAGWAAAAVAGLAGFFQIAGARATDRRLAAVRPRGADAVVAGRLLASVVLAAAAAAAALVALAVHGGIADPVRAIVAVVVVAVMYVAIGALVGTFVHSEMNGALVVSVIWMLDVFVGTGLGGSASLITRVFPMHFPTMVLTSQAAHHGGPLSSVAWTAIWATALAALAAARLVATTRPAHGSRRAVAVPGTTIAAEASSALPVREAAHRVIAVVEDRRDWSREARLTAALRSSLRDYRRNKVLWTLLIIVPVLFVALAAAQTPITPMPVALLDRTRHFTAIISLRHIHAAQMASIATALLAGVTGLFVITGSTNGDRRLVIAGYKPRQILVAHLGVILGAAVVITSISLAVSAAFFSPVLWSEYVAADLLIALAYAMLGIVLGPLVGRLGGLYVLLLLSMIDVGYGQTVMFGPMPPAWGRYLPSRGAARLLLDGAFTSHFEQYGELALALAWLGALSLAAIATFQHQTGGATIRHPHSLRAHQAIAGAPR